MGHDSENLKPPSPSESSPEGGAKPDAPRALFTLNSITDRLAKTLFGEEGDDADGAPPPRPVVDLHRQKRTWRPPSLRHPACLSPSTWPYALSPGIRRYNNNGARGRSTVQSEVCRWQRFLRVPGQSPVWLSTVPTPGLFGQFSGRGTRGACPCPCCGVRREERGRWLVFRLPRMQICMNRCQQPFRLRGLGKQVKNSCPLTSIISTRLS